MGEVERGRGMEREEGGGGRERHGKRRAGGGRERHEKRRAGRGMEREE